MRKLYFYLITLFLVTSCYLFSADGDKTIVRTIEFTQRRSGWFEFPNTDKKYQQILMHFKLRCPPGKPCGEWDYTSHVFLTHWYAPSFRVDKNTYETYSFMKDTSWNFSQETVDGKKVIIRTPKPPVKIEFYKDSENPTKPTDSMIVWPQYYSDYKFDDNGKAIDSTLVKPDSTLVLTKKKVFYNDDVTISDRWEIFRYITPYGNGLNLGTGVTWTFDVTDFAPVLTGQVHLSSPNGGWGDPYDQTSQEDLELTFEFIEGTPPRNVINIKKLWDFYGLVYDKYFEESVSPYQYNFGAEEKTAMMRVTQTGHGFGGTSDNCAEFCRKLGMAKVDGIKRYEQYVWRECGNNPVYPQGGTWIYDRSNWCPGAEVEPYDYEISQFINTGGTHTIDYDMEYYDLKWAGGSNTKPQWILTGFLFTYSDLNFNTDARINEIAIPNKDHIYNRYNPSCNGPVLIIQNSGKEPITKVKVEYGTDLNKLVSGEVNLDEPLNFMESTEIELPNNNYNSNSGTTFYAKISEINGKPDDNPSNNLKTSEFDSNLPEYFGNFSIDLRTPNSNVLGISSPIAYSLEDMDGNVLYSRKTTENSTTYNDKVDLKEGCYRFIIQNTQGFGLGFWAYQNSGLINGSLTFSIDGAIFKQFPTDWGNFYIHEFQVAQQPGIVLNLNSDTLDFGNVILGSKKTEKIEITPANSKGLKLENLNIILGGSKKFEIESTIPEINKFPYTLNYGEKIEVTVAFEPTSEGIKSSSLRITSNDFLNWQKNIALLGNGRDPNSVNDEMTDLKNYEFQVIQSLNSNYSELNIILESTLLNIHYTFELIDLLGNKIVTDSFINTNYRIERNYNSENLQSGVYFVIFRNDAYSVSKSFYIIR